MSFFDLHRHDEFSFFDGFGKAVELVEIAKKLGYKALGTSNHGNTSGIIKTYFACKEAGIKPIIGVEGYFLPRIKEEKRRGHHLCLFAKTLTGYNNINRILYEAEQQKYYNGIITFKELSMHSEGIICSSACVGGPVSQAIAVGKFGKAEKLCNKFKDIFGDDFYIELQPYKLSEDGLQEKVNYHLYKLARKLDIKCILTSDSHFGSKEDFDTYLKMHEIAGHLELGKQYKQRYMPSEEEIVKRFVRMHGDEDSEYYIKGAKKVAQRCILNLEDIYSKVDEDIFANNAMTLPKFNNNPKIDSRKVLLDEIQKGLKARGKSKDKKYVARCKEEYEVICHLGYEDYFLMVSDYANWAKEHGIIVGPGRGSGCNSQACWALKITEVDSLRYGLDFRRFLRKDKKKMPDIDLDFETARRHEVIQYLVDKYKGHSAQISSYGNYKVDNLINDLAKICGLPTTGELEKADARDNKQKITEIKSFVNKFIEDGALDKSLLEKDSMYKEYNKQYDNIIKHFSKLYMKVRFLGTHAAGVAITGGDIYDFTTIRMSADGKKFCAFDLDDLDKIKVTKFDILGLRTLSILKELRKLTKTDFDDDMTEDEASLERFKQGKTDGIFQFESKTAKSILEDIDTDCFEDVIAASSMNRPGPLSLGMPAEYANNKININDAKDSVFYEYTKETYGTLIYQEQIQQICVNMAGLSWNEADAIMKMMKSNVGSREARRIAEESGGLRKAFLEGAVNNGIKENEASETYDKLLTYSFNKGHAAGYSLISAEQMYHKVHNPTEFWYATLKYAEDKNYPVLSCKAVADEAVILLPHVNGGALHKLIKIDGERCIREGTSHLKGVGLKSAQFIEEEKIQNGLYTDMDDFLDRIEPYKRVVNKGVIATLEEAGALEFKNKVYFKRCAKYNSALYSKGIK